MSRQAPAAQGPPGRASYLGRLHTIPYLASRCPDCPEPWRTSTSKFESSRLTIKTPHLWPNPTSEMLSFILIQNRQ